MRKNLVLTLALAAASTGISAEEVDRQRAATLAQETVAEHVDSFDTTVASVETVSYQGVASYHVVHFSHGGWALIAADDRSDPLIAYSDSGAYQAEEQPENVRAMMEQYSMQIQRNAKLRMPHPRWKAAPAAVRRKATAKIAPLITVNWNQSGNYKKYCPKDAKGQALVGCVAVGMAQAMSVARYPERPVGEYSYNSDNYGIQYINYDLEPAYHWSDILSGANNRDDVARLLWHCGVAVNMNYGLDGSGTQDSYIATALQRNFQYPSSVRYYSRAQYDGDWQELILTELREGRAVAYSGSDPKKNYGHCFNLDGYDGSFFHVNWGWGGANNGYFSLNGLRDATMDMDYTDGQSVIVGIRPPSEKPSNILLSNTKVRAGMPKGTFVADVTVESEASNPSYTYTLQGKYNPITHKRLAAKFYMEDNKLLTSEVLSEGTQTLTIIAVNNQNQGKVERTFNILVTSADAIIEVSGPEHVAETYYTPAGIPVASPRRGLNIVKRQDADGTTKTMKIVR